MESITERPIVDSFVPLSEYQSQTPQSFFNDTATPVLHFHSTGATLVVSKAHLEEYEALRSLQGAAESETGDDIAISEVEVFVTSKDLILYAKEAGISLNYKSIALHALGKYDSLAIPSGSAQAVILQVNLFDANAVNQDEEMNTLDLVIIPSNAENETETTNSDTAPTIVKELFDSLSACADLHPDSDEEEPGEETGGTSLPGAGGWITAENMSQFMDSSGDFVGFQSLGPGAGSVRPREQSEPNGREEDEDDEEDDTKWQRTA